jgi:hypothetical protein
MSKVTELFNNVSDSELKAAILEIKENEKNGYIKEDGFVRKYARLTGEITGNSTSVDLLTTTINFLKVAAFRWVD